jgi:hypothetical protein
MQQEVTLKAYLPPGKGGWNMIKDQVISDFPNIPSGTRKDLKETRTTKSCLGRHILLRQLQQGIQKKIVMELYL